MAKKQIKREKITQEVNSDPVQAVATTVVGQVFPSSSGDTEVDLDVAMRDSLHNDDNSELGGSCGVSNNMHAVSSESSTATVANTLSSASGTPQSLEVLGRGVRELVQAIQTLRHLGVEDLVLPLPKIVVVGDQSTGKSSLIEGISEIKVPRSSGLCTRCPLEINLSKSPGPTDPWQCVVSLHKKYIYDGKTVTSRATGRTTITAGSKPEGASRKRPLGPWELQEGEYFTFAKTATKEDVAELLEWAQIATLNPQSSYEDYIPKSTTFKADRSCRVKFSPNVVRLEISGQELPNLSFYDLPGVINVSDVPEEGYLVDLVKNLVKQYIRADNCINLLCLPMTDDLANSSAFKLIREEAAENRTVGVLTKPDRLQEAESPDQWVHILTGARFKLGHGYHVVKNNPVPIVDHATARNEEKEFFAKSPPWSTTLAQYGRIFGTLNLQTFLSQRLTAQIQESLPNITRQVQQKLGQVDLRLGSLPEAPAGNLPDMVLEKLNQFESQIQKHFEGGDPEYALQKKWYNLAEDFRQLLANSRPVLIQPSLTTARSSLDSPSASTPTPMRKANRPEPIAIDSDSDDAAPPNSQSTPDRSTKKRVNGETFEETSTKRLRMSDIPQFASAGFIEKKSYSKSFRLPEIRNILQEAHIGLPNQIDPKATLNMIRQSVKVWEIPTRNFLDSTFTMCRNAISEVLDHNFLEWRNTLFDHRIKEIFGGFLEQAMTGQRETVAELLDDNIQQPFSLNVEAITTASQKALAILQERRREYRATQYLLQQDASIDRTPSRQSKTDRLAKVSDSQIGPDPWSQEVLAISNVKGFYEVAFSIFVDNVCQKILRQLFVKLRNRLRIVLKQELHLTDADAHEHCALLLTVSPEDEAERRQLTKEQEKLRKAQDWLEGLTRTEEGMAI